MTKPPQQPKREIHETPDGWVFVGYDLGDGKYERLTDLFMSAGAAQQWMDEHPEGEGEDNG